MEKHWTVPEYEIEPKSITVRFDYEFDREEKTVTLGEIQTAIVSENTGEILHWQKVYFPSKELEKGCETIALFLEFQKARRLHLEAQL